MERTSATKSALDKGPFASVAEMISSTAATSELAIERTPDQAALERLLKLGLVQESAGRLCWATSAPPEISEALVGLLDGPARHLSLVPAGAECPVAVYSALEEAEAPDPRWVGWGGAAGTSTSRRSAVVSCLFEAAERCSQLRSGKEPTVKARLRDIESDAINPADLLLFSRKQYVNRVRTNRSSRRSEWVPPPLDQNRSVEWVKATRVGAGRSRWVAAEYCYRQPRKVGERRVCRADSSGCASASTLEDATVRGFQELVERDAVAMWWFNRVRRPSVDSSLLGDEPMASIASWQRRKGRTLSILDLTTDLGIPVVAAVSSDGEGRGIAIGFGCGFDLLTAAARATVEMMQFHVQVNLGLFLHAALRTHSAAPQTVSTWRWFLTASIADHPHFVPLASPGLHAVGRIDRYEDRASAIERCVAAATRGGLPIYTIDLTRPEIGIPTVRVIVPGLRSMKPRFAPGRLYRTPVALGWLSHPLRETDLNTQPLVF